MPINQAAAASHPNRWFAEEVQLRGQFPSVRDVGDAVQESYLKIWRVRAEYPIDSARAFLFKIARHPALDPVRRKRSAPVDSRSSPDGLIVLASRPGAVEILLTHEILPLFALSIASLPPKKRAVTFLGRVGRKNAPSEIRRVNGTSRAPGLLVSFLPCRRSKH